MSSSDASSLASLESTGPRELRVGREQGRCGSWLVPLMVTVGVGLLLYLVYCSTCNTKKSSDNGSNSNNGANSGNGVVVTPKSPSSSDSAANGTVEKNSANGKSGKSVIDLEGERLVQMQQNQPVIVAFVAENCGWCKKFKPNYVEAAKKLDNLPGVNLHTLHVNSQKKMEICKVFNVRGFPTLLCVYKDRVLSEYKGDRTPDNIVEWVNSLVSSNK